MAAGQNDTTFRSLVVVLRSITFEVVEAYKAKRAKEAQKPRTVNKELQILSRMFSLGVKWRLCEVNPLRAVERLKDPKRPPRFLSVDEIARLLKAAERSHLHPVILAALHTGMRKGELLSLQWNDADFEKGMITVWASKTSTYRMVPMTPLLAETLRAMEGTKESKFLFTYGGKPTHDLKQGFGTLLKTAGITNCRFHDLRHTFCSHLAIAGVPLQKIKELAGHQNFQTTLLYAHLQPDHLKGEVTRLPFAKGIEDGNPPQC
jgi:integrase